MKWSKSKDRSFMDQGKWTSKNTALLKTTTLVVKDVVETETRIEKPVAEKQEIVEAEFTETFSR